MHQNPNPSKFHPASMIEPKIKSLRAVLTEEIQKYGGQVAPFDYNYTLGYAESLLNRLKITQVKSFQFKAIMSCGGMKV